MLELMWDLWPRLPAYGRKAFQFIDLIGYFTIKCASLPCSKVCKLLLLFLIKVNLNIAFAAFQFYRRTNIAHVADHVLVFEKKINKKYVWKLTF